MPRQSLKATSEGIATLKAALKRRKQSQTYLAGAANCSRQTIWSLLQGNAIDAEVFLRVCKLLDLSEYEVAEPEEDSEHLETDDLVRQVRGQIKARIHAQCGSMNVLTMTKPIGLGDIYTDVNILETIAGRKRLALKDLEAHCTEEEFERFGYSYLRKQEERVPGLEAVDRCRKMVVLGKPGAGKTTFLKRIATQCNGGTFHPELVPIFVPLKQFAETKGHPDLLPYIASQWAESKVKEADSKVETLLDEGRALVLLDGLDEVLKADSARVIEEIRHFSERFHRNLYVLTCRVATHEFKLEPFTEVEIADFDDEQIAVFVTKWFERKNPERTELFLRKLKDSPRIRELATNPLLLTLLCLNFEESGYFSESRAALYKDALHVLLKSWNAKKPGLPYEEVYRQLTPDRKEDLLSQLAYQTFEQGQYMFGDDIAKQHIRHYIENLPSADTNVKQLDVDSEAVLKSIEGQHGLLISRAQGIYSFSHLTFQEYFTARKIAASCSPYTIADKTLQELAQRVTDQRWREIFLLVAEILPSADCFLQAMKQHIDRLVAKDQTIQLILGWTQEKAASADVSYKAAAVRAFYLYCSTLELNFIHVLNNNTKLGRIFVHVLNRIHVLDFVRAFDHTLVLDLDHTLVLDLGLDHTLNLDLTLALTLDRALALNRFLNRDRVRALDLDHTLDRVLDRALDSDFRQVLKDLKTQLPNPEKNFSAFKDWWEIQGLDWVKKLRDAIIQYRNIGYKWALTPEQFEQLQQYMEANLLLVNCLNSNCYVSRSVRAEIEETLLLPIAAIEQHKSQGSF
ncbi:MAG TPA: NACHT domain-containing NTPase [Stenomitos sp.]